MARKLGHYKGDAVFTPQIFGVGQKHRVEHGDSALRRRKTAKNVRLVCFWILQLKGVLRVSKSLLMLRKWCPGAESNHRHEDFQWRWLKIHIRKHMLKYAKRICAKNVFNRKRAVSYFYRQNHSVEHHLYATLSHTKLSHFFTSSS
jgi:hypothetical protein